MKDKPKIQHGECLVSQVVTTGVGLKGVSGREGMRKKGHLLHLALLCFLSVVAGEASEWGRGGQQRSKSGFRNHRWPKGLKGPNGLHGAQGFQGSHSLLGPQGIKDSVGCLGPESFALPEVT